VAERIRSKRPQRGIQAVDHALRILDQFESSSDELSLTDLSERITLSKSGLYALLVSLARSGFVDRNEARNSYRLGAHLVATAGRRLEQTSRLNEQAVLRHLVDVTGETALLGTVEGDHARYLRRIDSPHLLRVVGQQGESVPFHATALGKVLLAQLPDEQIDAILARPLTAFTPRTTVDPTDLALELQKIRRQGYAVSLGERHASTAGVAAPVLGPANAVPIAVEVAGMLGRLDLNAAVVAVLGAARSLSTHPGGQEGRTNDGPATPRRAPIAAP
jgi:IclR family acetate operon transcriptional repressor